MFETAAITRPLLDADCSMLDTLHAIKP